MTPKFYWTQDTFLRTVVSQDNLTGKKLVYEDLLGILCLRYLSFRDSNWNVWSECVCVCVCVLVAQLCLTLCDPMNCSPPGSSVHGMLQARTLEKVAIPFSRASFQPRDWSQVSCIEGRLFTIWAIREALPIIHKSIKILGVQRYKSLVIRVWYWAQTDISAILSSPIYWLNFEEVI